MTSHVNETPVPKWARKIGTHKTMGTVFFGVPPYFVEAAWYLCVPTDTGYCYVQARQELVSSVKELQHKEDASVREYAVKCLKTKVRNEFGLTKKHVFGAGTLTVHPDGKTEYVTQHPHWKDNTHEPLREDQFNVTVGYESLHHVLSRAFDQAAKGKGKERHAGDLPFDEQPMQQISDLLNNDAGMAFQACKKIHEARGLPHEAKIRELLGAINYIAGMVIWHERHHQCAEAPTQKS